VKKQALIIALLAASGFASTSAFAADGTINITGEIQGLTCSVSGGPGTAPGTGGDFGVELPTVQTSALTSDGATAGSKPFSIQLGTLGGAACADGTNAAIVYEATSPMINPATGNLRNTVSGAHATNVEVQIMDMTNNAPMNLASGTASSQVVVAGNTAVLPFAARYIAAGGAATAGEVETSVQYSVTFP